MHTVAAACGYCLKNHYHALADAEITTDMEENKIIVKGYAVNERLRREQIGEHLKKRSNLPTSVTDRSSGGRIVTAEILLES